MRYFMKKVLFQIITVGLIIIFSACGKADTGKKNTLLIQNTATPYCEKVEECNYEEFSSSFENIEDCTQDFIQKVTAWYKEKSNECHKTYESLMTCMLELDCYDFSHNQTASNPCYNKMIDYYNLCEATEEPDEEENNDEELPVCSEGEKKCEGDSFYWCSGGKWYSTDCYENNQKICDENKGCVTED
jgi:hypothetical protein